jgi:hypothetical protein
VPECAPNVFAPKTGFLNKLSNVLGGGPAAQQQQQPAAGQMGAQQGQWGQGQTGTQGQWQGQQGQQAQNLQSVELDLTNYQILAPQALGTTDVSSFRPYYAVIVNGNESARQTIPAMSLSDLGVSNISQPINFRSKLIFTCDPSEWAGGASAGTSNACLFRASSTRVPCRTPRPRPRRSARLGHPRGVGRRVGHGRA